LVHGNDDTGPPLAVPGCWRATWWSLLVIGASSGACQKSDDRPPLAGDAVGEAKNDKPRPDETDDDLLVEDTESFNCGETSIELPVKRPSFYFVLDASESMLEVMTGTGGRTRFWGARTAIGTMLRAVGHRVNYGAAVFPEPHSDDACSAGAEVYSLRPGLRNEADAASNPQLDGLEFALRKITPTGATPISATLAGLHDHIVAMGERTHVFLLTDGAPNCGTNGGCGPSRCIPNIDGLRIQGGPDCDDSFNCCDTGWFPHLCLDDQIAALELEKLRDADVGAYVIGIPGSETYADVLDGLAAAAGTGVARDGGIGYYRVDDVEQLATTLTQLGQDAALTCELPLEMAPTSAAKVRVFADGSELLLDEEDGWHWLDETHVQLDGDACRNWKRGDWDNLRIVEGCDSFVR